MLTIYGVARSRATRNIWLLKEIGKAFDLVTVIQAYRLKDRRAPEGVWTTLSPEFLAISPAGAIPVMKDGDLILSESLAINLYIARTYGGMLGPQSPAEDALMQQWALYGTSSIEEHALGLYFANRDRVAGTPATPAIAHMADALRRPLAVLDSALSESGCLVGGRFTVADISLAEILRYAQSEPDLIAGFPTVDAWLKTCQARPAFKEMWAMRLAEPE